MRELLLMPCSATKLDRPAQPRELYLGPMWQTLRTHRGNLPWQNVTVLSGKYGIITALAYVQNYNERLTKAFADKLIVDGVTALVTYAVRNPGRHGEPPFSKVFNAGAGDYRRVFDAILPGLVRAGLVAHDAPVHHVSGGIGEQRSQLGKWLDKINGR